jgi:hypothetical protein
MKSSDVYKEALREAAANDVVTQALGSPIEPGWLVLGNINISDGSGTADLKIPISGPKGKAVIHVVATKTDGKWELTTLEVELRGPGAHLRFDLKAEHGPI